MKIDCTPQTLGSLCDESDSEEYTEETLNALLGAGFSASAVTGGINVYCGPESVSPIDAIANRVHGSGRWAERAAARRARARAAVVASTPAASPLVSAARAAAAEAAAKAAAADVAAAAARRDADMAAHRAATTAADARRAHADADAAACAVRDAQFAATAAAFAALDEARLNRAQAWERVDGSPERDHDLAIADQALEAAQAACNIR